MLYDRQRIFMGHSQDVGQHLASLYPECLAGRIETLGARSPVQDSLVGISFPVRLAVCDQASGG